MQTIWHSRTKLLGLALVLSMRDIRLFRTIVSGWFPLRLLRNVAVSFLSGIGLLLDRGVLNRFALQQSPTSKEGETHASKPGTNADESDVQ